MIQKLAVIYVIDNSPDNLPGVGEHAGVSQFCPHLPNGKEGHCGKNANSGFKFPVRSFSHGPAFFL